MKQRILDAVYERGDYFFYWLSELMELFGLWWLSGRCRATSNWWMHRGPFYRVVDHIIMPDKTFDLVRLGCGRWYKKDKLTEELLETSTYEDHLYSLRGE